MSAHTIGSLFAGIGGFDLGFERAGFRTAWACEIDKHCRALLAQKWPEAMLHDDVSTFDPDAFPCPSVITFGSPCQDLSVAGKRAGLEGERSGLFYESTRIISRYVARGLRFAIWENVPGAFTSNGGGDFGLVLRAMAQCGAVDIAWRVLDAQWFGVAQRRRRVFLVADFGGERAGEILSLTESLQGHPAPSRKAGEGSPASLATSVDTDFNGHGPPGPRGPLKAARSGYVDVVAPTVTSKWATGSGGPAGSKSECGNLVAPQGLKEVADTICARYSDKWGLDDQHINGGGGLFAMDTAPALTRSTQTNLGHNGGDDSVVAHCFKVRTGCEGGGKGYLGQDEKAFTVSTSPDQSVQYSSAVRRLTPRECERLQGFPDDWTAGQSDSTRYRQLGNAVAVPVAEWIAKNVAKALSDE